MSNENTELYAMRLGLGIGFTSRALWLPLMCFIFTDFMT
jgi:hypothetical protein